MSDFVQTLEQGLAHHRAGRLLEAETLYRRVLEAQPKHAQALHLLGLVAAQAGQLERALQCFDTALGIDPLQAAFHADRAEVLLAMGQTGMALDALRAALRLDPRLPGAGEKVTLLLEAQGELEEAAECHRRAIREQRPTAETWRRLGSILHRLGQFDEARSALEQAVAYRSVDVEAWAKLADCRAALGNRSGAVADYRRALRLSPDDPEVRYRCGQALLALGDFHAGWFDYEWRVACPGETRQTYDLPYWNGVCWPGQRLLVHADHGWADTLQMLRYVRLAEQRVSEVALDVPPALVPLLKQSGFANLEIEDRHYISCSVQARLLSLPGIFGTTLETIPDIGPYLAARPELVAEWRARLASFEGLTIGVAERADPDPAGDTSRSIPWDALRPLARLGQVRLVRLQPRQSTDQSEELACDPIGDRPDFDSSHGALMDTAALMANMDLVITADSALAHLAGGMGVPVWVALPSVAPWRWLQERSDSPWYSNMRLFRQTSSGGWSEVVEAMAHALSDRSSIGAALRPPSTTGLAAAS